MRRGVADAQGGSVRIGLRAEGIRVRAVLTGTRRTSASPTNIAQTTNIATPEVVCGCWLHFCRPTHTCSILLLRLRRLLLLIVVGLRVGLGMNGQSSGGSETLVAGHLPSPRRCGRRRRRRRPPERALQLPHGALLWVRQRARRRCVAARPNPCQPWDRCTKPVVETPKPVPIIENKHVK